MKQKEIKNKTAEEVCFEKLDIMLKALDDIITTHADGGTLKEIARKAIKQLPEKN